ncbi:MAG: imidazolonepropionase [Conexivisphaerales archaeon]
MNTNSYALTNIGELVTMAAADKAKTWDESSLALLHDAAVIVESGRVSWVGSMRQYRSLSVKAKEIDVKGRLVTPGFVDCHNHALFSGSREDELDRKLKGESYISILQSGGGIRRTIKETRESSESQLYKQTVTRIEHLIRNGVTTMELKTGYGQDIASEIKLLKVAYEIAKKSSIEIIPTFLGLHATPPEYESSSDYLSFVVKNMLPAIMQSEYKPVFADCFCESGIFNYDQCKSYLAACRGYGLRLKVHADEFSDSNGALLAAEMKCVSADHLEYSSYEGLKEMAKNDVVAVLLPATAFYSNIKPPDLSKIQAAGCMVALGTDISPNSWVESPQLVIALACNMMRMTPAMALASFTVGSAKALGRNDIGRIMPDCKADMILWDFTNYREIAYKIGGSYVSSVFKSGEKIYEDRNSVSFSNLVK